MKIKKLLAMLNKMNSELDIIGFDPYEEHLTKNISIEEYSHNGIESDCWHFERKFKSNIPAGQYLLINFGD
jgi:hypothetical protein